MDKIVFYRTVAYLRKQFLWSPQYRTVKKRCTIIKDVYRCEGCDSLVSKEDVEIEESGEQIIVDKFAIDHIVAVGSLDHRSLDKAAEAIFCDVSNLQGLCGTCHYLKSQVDNEETREKKKSLLQKIILGE